jgi:integral membrane protein (TIGR01906 family)
MIENNLLKKSLQVVITVLVLVILLIGGVRLLLTDTFLQIEYGMAYFPEDSYGMTQAERLRWAPLALDYLLNSEDISFLGDLTFEDGSPLYNERELRHMLDVKVLTQQILIVWYVCLGVFLALTGWAWFGGWWQDFRKMLSVSGMVAVGLVGTLVFLILISFNQIFTGFHRIFFEGDSWLFKFSDTLIRLFPLRFWQDAFIFVGIFTLVVGLALWRAAPARQKTA